MTQTGRPVKRAPLETRRHYARRVEARTEFLADIIITAVEGGTNYWASAFGYTHTSPSETRVVLVPSEDLEEAGLWSGKPITEAWLSEHGHEVTTAKVEAVLERIRTYEVQIALSDQAMIDHANHETDAGHIDADLADTIVQIACFGEVVYG